MGASRLGRLGKELGWEQVGWGGWQRSWGGSKWVGEAGKEVGVRASRFGRLAKELGQE